MNFTILKQVRQQTYGCFHRSADALLELVDALSCEPAARSLPELSLSPAFRRKWGSVYEALQDGHIDQMDWSRIWTQALLKEQQSPVWISVDSTSIARPEAETSPDRGIIYVPNLPHAKRPVSIGWQFSTVMLLPTTRSSWGAILTQRRIHSSETAVEVAIEQVEHLVPDLPAHTRLLADRWYVTGPFLQACQRLQMGACCAANAIANCIEQRHRKFLENADRPAKTEPCFKAANPKAGVSQMKSGKAKMSRVSDLRSRRGITCMFGKRVRSR